MPSSAERPLVAPGPALTAEQFSRYSRQLMLPGFGDTAQRRLRAARVLIIGAGGLGTAVAPVLAASGIGTLGLIDDDVVELSNLHRQLAHGVADLGRPKVDSLADAIAAIDPGCRVVRHQERVTAATLPRILAGYDLLVDGSDNFPTRYLANDAAVLAGVPLVWGAILRFHGQVGVAWHGHGPTYRDLFPSPPPADEALSCELGGVLPTLCTAVGSFLATEVIKLVTGLGEPLLGRVLTYDALTARTREIPYGVSPETPAITGLVDYDLFCGVPDDGDLTALSAAALAGRMRAGERMTLVDVREPEEVASRRIPGSVAVPLGALRTGAPVPAEGPFVLVCERDPRARTAARLLRERGLADVAYLAGGIQSYVAVGGEVEGDDIV